MNLKSVILAGLMVSLASMSSLGQDQAPESKVIFERQPVMQGPAGTHMPPVGHDTFVFVASEVGFNAKVVKGSPYSAEATTEAVQTLSDGNRIVRKSSAVFYRDSEGRTRREQTLAAIGPFATAGDPPKTIHINDPVAGISYMLDPNTRIARKMAPLQAKFATSVGQGVGKGTGQGVWQGVGDGVGRSVVVIGTPGERSAIPPGAKITTTEGTPGAAVGRVFTHRLPEPGSEQGPVVFWHAQKDAKVNTESLGSRIIEGVAADGTRQTFVIPAGEMGNERPIEVVSERWFSPELQTVVMTVHRDPRFGETIYRLTNINRGEPDRSLFEVPGDYTVKDAVMPAQKILTRKPASQQ